MQSQKFETDFPISKRAILLKKNYINNGITNKHNEKKKTSKDLYRSRD